MMTEKQQIAKYEKERVDVAAQVTKYQTRLDALDGVLKSLRVMTGEAPAPATRLVTSKATGTKALILDVLADGKRRRLSEIAEAIKVKPVNAGFHLGELVKAGDVERTGKSRATTYGIA